MRIFNLRKGNARNVVVTLAVITISTFFILMSFTGCAKKETKVDKISVRLMWIPNVGFSGDIIAKEKGFFKENGLEVAVHPGGFELDPIKLVASGSDDIGITGADQLILAKAKEIPLVAIGVLLQYSPVVFLSKKSSGIKTPQDFVGKKVGVKIGTVAEPMYNVLLKNLGIDRSKITEVPIKFHLSPFVEDRIDVFPCYEFNEPLQLDKLGVKYNIIYPKDYGIDIYSNVYFVTEKTLYDKPDIIEKYLRSVIKGYEWAFEHKEEATRIVVEFNKNLDYETELRKYDKIEPYLRGGKEGRILWMERDKWMETQNIYIESGIINEPIDINKVFTRKFIDNIYSE